MGGRYTFVGYKMFSGYKVRELPLLGNINSPRLGGRSFHTICVGAASGNNDVRHTFTSCNVIVIILHCHHHHHNHHNHNHDPHLPLIVIAFFMTTIMITIAINIVLTIVAILPSCNIAIMIVTFIPSSCGSSSSSSSQNYYWDKGIFLQL